MNQKVILIVSFGTTHEDSFKKNIEAAENQIKNAYPGYEIRRAFTSRRVIRYWKDRGLLIHTVEEALEQICRDGGREVYVQPTHMIAGQEYDELTADCMKWKDKFDRMKIGVPLLWNDEDRKKVLEILRAHIHLAPGEALILMGHGTEHHGDSVYASISEYLQEEQNKDIYLATVDGALSIDQIGDEIAARYQRVILTPLMLVAGDHAKNDMAGDKDSWKTYLEEKGLTVTPLFKGLGEYDEIRAMYLDHMKEYLGI